MHVDFSCTLPVQISIHDGSTVVFLSFLHVHVLGVPFYDVYVHVCVFILGGAGLSVVQAVLS